MLAVEVERGGTSRELVLRVHDRAWFTDEPEALAREVVALTRLDGTDIPAPRLMGWSERDPAAVLMSRVPGAPELTLPDPGAVRALLDRLHALPPDGLSEWSYRGYHEDVVLVRPAWWHDAAIWERAVRQTETNRPEADAVVIHRDFHPGNILWAEGRLSGVVDWVSACVGPAAFDVSHLRVNLAVLHGPDEPDRAIGEIRRGTSRRHSVHLTGRRWPRSTRGARHGRTFAPSSPARALRPSSPKRSPVWAERSRPTRRIIQP